MKGFSLLLKKPHSSPTPTLIPSPKHKHTLNVKTYKKLDPLRSEGLLIKYCNSNKLINCVPTLPGITPKLLPTLAKNWALKPK